MVSSRQLGKRMEVCVARLHHLLTSTIESNRIESNQINVLALEASTSRVARTVKALNISCVPRSSFLAAMLQRMMMLLLATPHDVRTIDGSIDR